ncbi:MAG: TatD family hydrolase [Sporichthyaceae bacterium]|nr:TatD family hydrolase [Sporichthyaceae bacterium]
MTEGPTRVRSGPAPGARGRPPAPEPLPVPVADSHCHLDIADPPEDWLSVEEALTASAAVGVPRIVQIGCDLTGARWAAETATRHGPVVAGVALHPNEAPRLAAVDDLDDALAEIDRLAELPAVRAVGETGLDHFRTRPEGRGAQEASFRAHIEMAKRHGKALVVHDRDAHADVLRVLAEEGPPDRVVLHCFSGDREMARQCVRQGWWLSFAGTVTFKNATPLRGALAVAPLDRVLVETDAPYLTPTPYRGRPNASYLMPITVRAMADVLATDLETLCAAIDANSDAAFGSW